MPIHCRSRARNVAAATFLLFAFVLLGPSIAQAKRGLAIINTGEDVDHVGDIQPKLLEDVKAKTRTANPAIGFMYSEFGIFWLNLWAWDGKYVIFEETKAWDLTPEQAATFLGVTPDKLPKPLTYTFPPGLMILLLLGIGIAGYWFFVGRHAADEAETEPAAAPQQE